MKRLMLLLAFISLMNVGAYAQRTMDKLDRGLVAVKVQGGVFCSWRIMGEEYYDVKYNLYRDGTKIAENLEVSNYTDPAGTTYSKYTVSAVVRGKEQSQSKAVNAFANSYLEIALKHDSSIHSTLVPNDACCADVDGDGEVEILLKFDNQSEISNHMQKNGYFGEYSIFEVLKLDGTLLWWVNCGPNMGDFQNNEQNIVGYDWDMDGKAEVLMRLEEGSVIHMANGDTYTIGADGNNGTAWTNYREPRGLGPNKETVALAFNLPADATATTATTWLTASIKDGVLYATTAVNPTQGDGQHSTGRTGSVTLKSGSTTTSFSVFQLDQNAPSVEWFTHYGNEFLVYCNGQTGQPYVVTEFPLRRLESGETDLSKAWGDGYGHRSSKFFFGAPYLDGRKPSIFLARGIYTRHKMIALDVDPDTHKLTERWRWNCNDSSSPYYGQGFHNYAIADVDWDGRDEICFGGMVIDDNGKGLSTTGLGHGDAQHHGDFDPYTWGQEIYTCQESRPNNCFRDGTTAKIRYRSVGSNDDGRSMAGNFCNDYPGAMGLSARDEAISCVTNGHINGLTKNDVSQNMRIYWDGDLQEESFNYSNGKNTAGGIYKYGKGLIATLTGSMTNNDTKGTPCFQGDVFGDWREEVIMRTADNNIRIYTTTTPTNWRNYTLWHDMQYRNAMVWQMCGYNQPPHASYFLGELEGITQAPPALTMTNRLEITNGGTISTTDQMAITCETNDMEVTVTDACEPYIYIDNAPSWVQGTNSTSTTNPDIKYQYYTHTLKGGAFAGTTRVVKQGDGKLILPTVVQKYTGPTDVWAGTLQFDGTLENSPLWLNRHTTLISDGGQFSAGITADYNATIYPGGQGKVGNMTVSALKLGFGSRLVFDINGTNADHLTIHKLTIEKKVWPKGGGPRYDTPIFQIDGNPAAGTYILGTINEVAGNISDIIIEGLTGKKATLDYADGKLTLTIQGYEPADLTWTGAAGLYWNTDESTNFVGTDGQPAVFVPGSTVTFDDNARQTSITVKGNVAPAAIIFNNDARNFIINGDSIVGEPTLTKNGSGEVTINNINHMGITNVNGGKLNVKSLANNSGQEYGSVGAVNKRIQLANGATLGIKATTISNQILRISEGGGVVEVASGATLTQSANITGQGQTLTKTGSGTLTLGTGMTISKLVVNGGNVNAQLNSSTNVALPATVEFHSGQVSDPNNQGAYATNATNFIVPEGKSGTLLCDPRCNYTGMLTGSGTFTVIAAGVRGYFNGDWSKFEGTLVPGLQKRGSYDPTFNFTNSKGLPKATLRLNSGVTFSNNDPDGSKNRSYNVTIGSVTGTGTLAGNGTYTIGVDDKDFTVSFKSTSPVIKSGQGTMFLTAGKFSAPLTISNGKMSFFTAQGTSLIGTNALTVKNGAAINGFGQLASLTLENGSELTIYYVDEDDDAVSGTLTTIGRMSVNDGAKVTFVIETADRYSKLQPNSMVMNGTVAVTLGSAYVPKKGDAFTLWTTEDFGGTPSWLLPQLPSGLYWDATELAKSGVLRITDNPTGISQTTGDVQVECEVFTLSGVRLGSFHAQRSQLHRGMKNLGILPGTYIVRVTSGGNTTAETVIIR